jgi:hypothetical protein
MLVFHFTCTFGLKLFPQFRHHLSTIFLYYKNLYLPPLHYLCILFMWKNFMMRKIINFHHEIFILFSISRKYNFTNL